MTIEFVQIKYIVARQIIRLLVSFFNWLFNHLEPHSQSTFNRVKQYIERIKI